MLLRDCNVNGGARASLSLLRLKERIVREVRYGLSRLEGASATDLAKSLQIQVEPSRWQRKKSREGHRIRFIGQTLHGPKYR